VLALCITVMLAGCRDDDVPRHGPEVVHAPASGEPRGVRLGFGALPAERTGDSYVQAFATAAQYADVIAIQRNPPWADFMPGGNVSDATAGTTRFELELLDQYGNLKVFYAIDPTDSAVQRSRLANLPPGIDQNAGFTDERLRNAFVAYAAYVAKNYRPDYLALGVEVNMLRDRNPRQFEAFVAAYHEAYVVAKGASPSTKVFPTFQLEDIEGRLGNVHAPAWSALDPFRGQMDVLAISTYPFLTDFRDAAAIRSDYYSQLKTYFRGEILISETAYPSAPVEGQATVGTEEDQLQYLQRLLSEAELQGFSLVVWVAALDPLFAREGTASVFRDIGLRKTDGSNKLAWTAWEEWARRPLR
jgi:hypothetical protein